MDAIVSGEHFLRQKRKIKISPTPVVLAYFAERKKCSRQEITKAVYQVAESLSETCVRMEAVFRGDLSEPFENIQSETVDDEIWYWLSNGFLRENDSFGENDLYFEVNKPLEEYSLSRIVDNLKEISWPSEEDRQSFLDVLREVISIAPTGK